MVLRADLKRRTVAQEEYVVTVVAARRRRATDVVLVVVDAHLQLVVPAIELRTIPRQGSSELIAPLVGIGPAELAGSRAEQRHDVLRGDTARRRLRDVISPKVPDSDLQRSHQRLGRCALPTHAGHMDVGVEIVA